jgi:hypothetical protein
MKNHTNNYITQHIINSTCNEWTAVCLEILTMMIMNDDTVYSLNYDAAVKFATVKLVAADATEQNNTLRWCYERTAAQSGNTYR